MIGKLPEYSNPPINEVVLGAQFQPPTGYNIMLAGNVWALFRDRYPRLEVQPPVQPVFETFGGVPEGSFAGVGMPQSQGHPRFWWIDGGGHNLIQFQSDKLFTNWRQFDHELVPYPRFERVYADFGEAVAGIDKYATNNFGRRLIFNQAEISYYNRIYGPTGAEAPRPDYWLKFLSFGERHPEGFNGTYREVVYRAGRPVGRLYVEVNSSVDSLGRQMIVVAITFRGRPGSDDVSGVLDTISMGHEIVVSTFSDITTEEAQQIWGRII